MNNHILQIGIGWNLFFDEDSSDEEKSHLEKVWGFAENTIPQFADHQFRQHFRMAPRTFEILLTKMHDIDNHEVRSGHPELALEKQAMITIWCLSNVECFRSVGNLFGISKSTCWDVLYRTCKKLLLINEQNGIISWPTGNRAREIIDGFENICGFPGVIGAIDGSHISIIKPNEYPNSYVNRKGFSSILLQGVCDHKKLFTDVFTGVPGSVHDSRLFRMSDLNTRIEQNLIEFPENSHLIGDLAYVLNNNLIVGFKNLGNLTNNQKNFNQKLSQTRVVIENAFAYLKGRFRRLKMLETVRLDLIALLIVSACILHNICILEGDFPEDLVGQLDEVEDYEENAPIENINALGRAKRDLLVNILNQP